MKPEDDLSDRILSAIQEGWDDHGDMQSSWNDYDHDHKYIEWKEMCEFAKTNPTVKDALDKLVMVYMLAKQEKTDDQP